MPGSHGFESTHGGDAPPASGHHSKPWQQSGRRRRALEGPRRAGDGCPAGTIKVPLELQKGRAVCDSVRAGHAPRSSTSQVAWRRRKGWSLAWRRRRQGGEAATFRAIFQLRSTVVEDVEEIRPLLPLPWDLPPVRNGFIQANLWHFQNTLDAPWKYTHFSHQCPPAVAVCLDRGLPRVGVDARAVLRGLL